jgi:hypothetical protein
MSLYRVYAVNRKTKIESIPEDLPILKGISLPDRNCFLIGLIGTNRTGKTSKVREIVQQWKASRPGQEVVAFDPQLKLQDLIDRQIGISDDLTQLHTLRNCLLVFDDFRALHLPDKTEKWLVYLMQFRDQWNIDIIYVVHNPSLVLTVLSFFTTHYYIFYTQSIEGGWKKKIPTYTVCSAVSSYLVEYVSIAGMGTYPKFPHFIVDNKGNKAIAVNIKSYDKRRIE